MKIRWVEFLLLSGIYLFLLMIVEQETKVELQTSYHLQLLSVYAIISTYIFLITPFFSTTQTMLKGTIWLMLTFFIHSFLLLGIHYWLPIPSHNSIPPIVLSGLIFSFLVVYTLLRIGIKLLIRKTSIDPFSVKIVREFLVSFAIGFAIVIFLFQLNAVFAVLTGISIPFIYSIFAIHHYLLLPLLDRDHLSKFLSIFLSVMTILINTILFASLMQIIVSRFGDRYDSFDGLNIIVCLILGIILTPMVYQFYFHQSRQKKQMLDLSRELGHTSADLRLLQSQVNPHFLFNVMNTLYGISLQENAVRTAAGIEKLSDMMRFMIHENQQDSILLSRELDYLKKYIELQRLRIADIPTIKISHNIPEHALDKLYIAPMLLIPFVENAFKHGISLNNPSWIRIQIAIQQGVLTFNVYNSVHHNNTEGDLEHAQSGIGLKNVKSRLQLAYKDRYQLRLEKTLSEFFVFLTIPLNPES